ncbi:MAG: hypothetical protein JO272_01445 [Pseudonocardiales bacterium]|nr:hypothetical protein [Pseudonocardiales bacterium]
MDEIPGSEAITQLGTAFMGSKALFSAVELGVFAALADGPRNGTDLAEQVGLHPRSSRDFLDALVALGLLEREGEHYANTPTTDALLDPAKPSYIGGRVQLFNALCRSWDSLTEALRTGKPQNEFADKNTGGGEDFFSALYADREWLEQFTAAMTAVSSDIGCVLAQKFPWDRYHTVMDIGTAQGGLPVQLALRHPHLRGGGFDLPPVGPIFEAYVASFELAARLRFHPGDMFTDELPAADVLVMGHMLHGWDLAAKHMLLAKAHAALPAGGALIVYDAIIDDDRRVNAASLLRSLSLLLQTPGGFEYTGADCCGWMREAGFTRTYVEHLVGPERMVVGIK